MKRLFLALFLGFGLGLPAIGAVAVDEDLQMVGLAMHQETGRNIFLGALYSNDPAARITTLQQGDGTGVLEHRVVARRTSIRSLLGKLLLQGEVATGKPPTQATIQFADDIMSLVQGSLYAGDSLTIELTGQGTTKAVLNGHALAVSGNQGVFYYFLSAWVGEKGPSTAFRSAILSPRIDSSLLTVYTANDTSADRQAEVALWLEQMADDESPAESTNPPVVAAKASPSTSAAASRATAQTTPEKKTDTAVALVAATAATAAAVSSADDASSVRGAAEKTASAAEKPQQARPKTPETPDSSGNDAQALQLAMATPPENSIGQLAAVDAMAYAEQLGIFNNDIIRRVYAEIRYPRSAIRRSLQGSLELDVTLDRSGNLVDVEIAQSSGYGMLDKSALSAAKKAFKSYQPDNIDAVAVAEYGDVAGELLIVPVPVSFILTD